MKSCGERQADLKAYLDGELPLHERAAMWWHLLHCTKCREASSAMTEISRRVGDIDGDALPSALRSRILSSVTYSDNPVADASPGPVRKHRVRPPLILVGGATAAALIAIVLMRPLLAPTMSKNTTAGSAVEMKSSTAPTASPVMPPASKMPAPQSAAGNGRASFAASGGAPQAPARPAQSQNSRKTQDYDETTARPPATASAPAGTIHDDAKPLILNKQEESTSAKDTNHYERQRALGQPSNAHLPGAGHRESDYMNVFPGDQAGSANQAAGKTVGNPLKSELQKQDVSESRREKARAKAQAQRNARTQRNQASQSHSSPRASSK